LDARDCQHSFFIEPAGERPPRFMRGRLIVEVIAVVPVVDRDARPVGLPPEKVLAAGGRH
jgi:hypothetical protein